MIFLLEKSQEKSGEFDVLYFARSDIEDALIPSQVKIINTCSFNYQLKLKTITFSINSQLKEIKSMAFYNSTLKKLVLPASIESIDNESFGYVEKLTEIKISPENKHFKIIDNKYLLKKSCPENPKFDVLVFARRDIEDAVIPSYIKEINYEAFAYFKQLKSITFEPNSSLEKLK